MLNSEGLPSFRNYGKPGRCRDSNGNIRSGSFGQLQGRPFWQRSGGGRGPKRVCRLASNSEIARVQRKFNAKAVCEAAVYKPIPLNLSAAAKELPQ